MEEARHRDSPASAPRLTSPSYEVLSHLRDQSCFLSYLPNPFLPQTRSFQHGHQSGAGLTPVSALALPDSMTLDRALDLSMPQFALLQRIDVEPCSLQPKQEVDFGPHISFIRPFYQWANHIHVEKSKKK